MPQPATRLLRGRVADQIVDDLRRQILSGALADGARLPSERELAAQYDVSAPTVREAVRVLTAMGLLSTRNGSRSVVTARSDVLLRMSIASVVQFERMEAKDVLGLLETLQARAAELAVENASDEDIASLRAAAEGTAKNIDAESTAAALNHFFTTLAAISHNPLLAALCKAITEIQLGLVVAVSGRDSDGLQRVARPLYRLRNEIVDAIAARDAEGAAQLVRDYHRAVIKRITASPKAKAQREPDPGLTTRMSEWLDTHVGLANGPSFP
jgi:GntR family transcriptional repressor for pyruvate dehydrogenase complex